jgi:general L-amino acid transport system permease protein
MTARATSGYVRREEAPVLPPPPGTTGFAGWLRQNLFASPGNALVTVVFGLFLGVIAWAVIDWALIRAVWTGEDRAACAVQGAGACWPFVWAKFPQWLFGFYPIEERWRPALVFLIGAAGVVPMLIPSAPYKQWNALFLAVAFPVLALILLSGGNFGLGAGVYVLVLLLALLVSVLLPIASLGLEKGIKSNRTASLLALAGLAPAFLWLVAEGIAALGGLVSILASALGFQGFDPAGPLVGALLGFAVKVNGYWLTPYAAGSAIALAAALSLWNLLRSGGGSLRMWLAITAAAFAILLLLDTDFGLSPVETQSWGGLLVTLVVSVTGIAASLPLGILLALGRRSKMPIVRLLSVVFIEVWRGVPLITVLFMSSVMLPLFLPEGMSFDKLLRALIGISLFSAAYMAEVVRGGLQAIGRGQYEGSMALGLSYWQTMRMIVLPQALKVSIPNIVGNFIGLFKDTTLVMIIGLYDFLGIITAGTQDAKWASPQTANTGYFVAAVVFWVFCYGMSRYARFTEHRLSAGTRR